MLKKRFIIIIFILVTCIIAFNIINLLDAYGSGPPYYSRTTNMDKWENPLPVIVTVDFLTILALIFCFKFGKNKK